MKDLAVVYMSKYGHTKQYADWLKEEFDADVIAASSFSPTKSLAYKVTVFASGVYGDKIQIMDWLKKNGTGINPAKIMIAAVSWYTNDSEEAKERLIRENYPENFRGIVPLFVINSGIDKKKISAVEKMQLVASQVAIDKHETRTSDDINSLAIIKGYSDQTSKDNLRSLSAAIENFLHPPKAAPKKATEGKAQKAVTPPPAPAAEEKPAPVKETAAKPAAEPVRKPAPAPAPAPAPKGEHEVTSLDDALAALGSGNILLNKPPMHRRAPEPAKAEVPEQTKAETTASAGMEIPEVPTLAQAVSKHAHEAAREEAQAAEPAPVKPEAEEQPAPESHKYAGIEIPEVPTLAEAVNKHAHEPVHEEKEQESNRFAGIEIPEVPNLADIMNKKANSEPAHEEDDAKSEGRRIAGIEISDGINEPVRTVENPHPAPAPAPGQEIRREPVTLRRPEPFKPAEPAAPSKNSYLEFFSKKNMEEQAAEPVQEDIQPVYEAPEPEPAPAHSGTVDDFDFDILGTGSSTAGKVSSRALNAVEALAKARAKAAAEAKDPKPETSESSGPTTYDVVSNSMGMNIPEPEAAPVYSAPEEERPAPEPVYEEKEQENEQVYEEPAPQPEPDEEEENTPEFSEDDVFTFSNDSDYDISDIDPSKLLEPEEQQKDYQRLDFKKLQEEIEASIEVNKKIRDKEKYRNMRESERRALEEEEQKPKRGIKQPEDPDIFFKRPGKDYYASDSMPEIRFNRHKHDQ